MAPDVARLVMGVYPGRGSDRLRRARDYWPHSNTGFTGYLSRYSDDGAYPAGSSGIDARADEYAGAYSHACRAYRSAGRYLAGNRAAIQRHARRAVPGQWRAETRTAADRPIDCDSC